MLYGAQLYLYNLGINVSRRPAIASVSSPVMPGISLTLATTDGVMLLRHLLGITNAAAITNSVKHSARSDVDVRTAIEALMPRRDDLPVSSSFLTNALFNRG